MKNYELMRSLHARGETTSSLAARILSSHGHVSMTLNNRPGRGAHTRRKLAPLLTAEERAMVGWDSTGNIVPKNLTEANEGNEEGRKGILTADFADGRR